MIKKNLTKLILIVQILLILMMLYLLIFPLNSSTSSLVIRDYSTKNFPEQELIFSFTSDVYFLNRLFVSFAVEDANEIEAGFIRFELFNNETGLLDILVDINDFKMIPQIKLDFIPQKDSLNKGYLFRISSDSSLIDLDEPVFNNVTFHIYGRRPNYFFVWYPLTALVFITTFSILYKGERKNA